MNQTSVIAVSILIAYIVFITTRGELQQYLAIVGIGALPASTSTPLGQAAAAQTNQSVNPMTKSSLGNLVNLPPFGGIQ